MRLIGGGDDDVLARAQPEALRHLPEVDVGFGACLGGVEEEEVLLQVLLVPMHLTEGGGHTSLNIKGLVCEKDCFLFPHLFGDLQRRHQSL